MRQVKELRDTNMSKNLKLIKDLIHIQLKKSLSELKEVEADTDTEFKVSLKHLLKKHVVKGGEVEEAELEKEKFTEPDQMREAINVKSLKSKYEKAIKSIEKALMFYPSFKSGEMIPEIERLIREESI